MIRAELPDAAVIFASTSDIVEDVDIKIVIDSDGTSRQETPQRPGADEKPMGTKTDDPE